MKATKITLAGTDYYLAFNGAAMFDFEEAFGGTNQFMDRTKAGGRDAFSSVCKAVSILAEQGELARRAMGYDSGPILAEETVRALATPIETAEMQRAVINAILAGYKREVPSEEAEDLGLIELEQKKQKGDPRALSAHGGHLGIRGEGDLDDVSRPIVRFVGAVLPGA